MKAQGKKEAVLLLELSVIKQSLSPLKFCLSGEGGGAFDLGQRWRGDDVIRLSPVSKAPIPNFAFTREPRWASHGHRETRFNLCDLCHWSHHFLTSFRPLVLFCYGVFLNWLYRASPASLYNCTCATMRPQLREMLRRNCGDQSGIVYFSSAAWCCCCHAPDWTLFIVNYCLVNIVRKCYLQRLTSKMCAKRKEEIKIQCKLSRLWIIYLSACLYLLFLVSQVNCIFRALLRNKEKKTFFFLITESEVAVLMRYNTV